MGQSEYGPRPAASRWRGVRVTIVTNKSLAVGSRTSTRQIVWPGSGLTTLSARPGASSTGCLPPAGLTDGPTVTSAVAGAVNRHSVAGPRKRKCASVVKSSGPTVTVISPSTERTASALRVGSSHATIREPIAPSGVPPLAGKKRSTSACSISESAAPTADPFGGAWTACIA